jgi:hypothetical protein
MRRKRKPKKRFSTRWKIENEIIIIIHSKIFLDS